MNKKLTIGVNCEVISYNTRKQLDGTTGVYVNVIDDENNIFENLYAGAVRPNLLEYMSMNGAGVVGITDDADRVYNSVEEMINAEWAGTELE